MLIKGVEGNIDNHKVSIVFPDKKSIILKGTYSLELMYLIESLLSNDMTGYYAKADVEYGISYKEIGANAQIAFNDGLLYSKDQSVFTKGTVPIIHIIRYLTDDKFRSIITGDETIKGCGSIYSDMTKYSTILNYPTWQRLVFLTNSLLGYDMVSADNNTLKFNIVEGKNNWSGKAQKFVYLLLAECFVTPKNVHRVLLIPKIDILSKEQQIRLFSVLDNIKGHSLLLSNLDVKFNDLTGTSIQLISV